MDPASPLPGKIIMKQFEKDREGSGAPSAFGLSPLSEDSISQEGKQKSPFLPNMPMVLRL